MTRGFSSRALGRALCLILALVAASPATAQPTRDSAIAEPSLRIQQLDVGQGDAALITTPEGRQILIDAGPSADRVAAMLRAQGVDTLDLVIASHGHADHIGGMAMVFQAFVVRAYVDNGIPHTTATYRRTLDAIEREPGLRYLQPTDRAITIGPVTVRILSSPRPDGSQNNNSVGVVVEYGQFRALYTGDSEVPELAGWIAAGRIPRVTMVKVAHHGSWNGTTPELVRAASPAIAVISVSARNSYGHPSPQVERMWSAGRAAVYRTDRDGTVEVVAKGDGSFVVRTARGRVGVPR
jgi:beta-lactamase superfamily II metal-dependent hydrolase